MSLKGPGKLGEDGNKSDPGGGTEEGASTDQPVAAHHDHHYRHPKYFWQSLGRFLCCCKPPSSPLLVFWWLGREYFIISEDGRDRLFLEQQGVLLWCHVICVEEDDSNKRKISNLCYWLLYHGDSWWRVSIVKGNVLFLTLFMPLTKYPGSILSTHIGYNALGQRNQQETPNWFSRLMKW